MYLCLFSLLSIKSINEDINENVQTFTAYNFGDYSFQLDNINDKLKIEVPPNTLIFISSPTGYKATVKYKEDNEIQTLSQQLIPNVQDRLIYFKDTGYIDVTSTINNLQFIFHTLVLSKISHHFDEIIISTNPYEKFHISYDYMNNKQYDYNSSFTENHLLWFISYNYTMCYIRQDVATMIITDFFSAHPILFAFPFHSYNESQVQFTRSYELHTQTRWLRSYSKLILIEKVDSLSIFSNSYVLIENEPNYTSANYYTDYRSVFRRTSLNETRILRRGSNHINLASKIYSKDLSDGIIEFDFSVYNKIELNINYTLLIFPTVSCMRMLNNDCALGIIQKQNKVVLESGSYDFVDESDMNVKIIFYHFKQDEYETQYIISTSPHELLKIGNEQAVNYTNNRSYMYFMASLANTKTTVEFKGEITFKKISINKISSIQIESGNTIDGPFIAYIKTNAECSFETSLNDDKNDVNSPIFENEGNSFFRKNSVLKSSQNTYISKKYGAYYPYTTSLSSISVYFDSDCAYLIKSSNLVHIWPYEGWGGEVLLDELNDKRIGIEYNRTSFYIPKSGRKEIQMMIWKNSINNILELYIKTIPIENYENQKNCSRVVVFNDFPSKFGINIKPSDKYNRIDIDNEVVCVFPALSNYYVGSNMSIEVLNSNHEKATKYSSTSNEKYCEGVSYYEYYGTSYSTLIKLDSERIESKGVIGFIEYGSHTEKVPFVYYDFEIKDEFAIHSFGENKYVYIEKGDDIVVEERTETPAASRSMSRTVDYSYKDIEIELNGTNKNGFVDMNRVRRLTFSCPKSTVFFIHYMNGFVVKFDGYERHMSNNEINQNSACKIIHFGSSNGFITVERSNSNHYGYNYNDQFVYSFMVMERINGLGQLKTVDKIHISSDPTATVVIKGPENQLSIYNHILPSNASLCLWFPFPIYSELQLDSFLPHRSFILVDNEVKSVQGSTNAKNFGFNYVSFLANASSADETGYAEFRASALYEGDLIKVGDYEVVNDLYKVDSTNGILLKIEQAETPKEVVNKEKDKKKFNVMHMVVPLISVFAIVIIVVIVVLIMKHRRVQNEETIANNQTDSLADLTNANQEHTDNDGGDDIIDNNGNDDISPYDASNAYFNSAQAVYIAAPYANEANDSKYTNIDQSQIQYVPF